MVKKKKEENDIEEIPAPISPISPIFSNIVDVRTHKEIVMLDFGFIAPNYSKPETIEVTQISRICIPWGTIELLSETLSDAISDRKKSKSKTKKTKNNN